MANEESGCVKNGKMILIHSLSMCLSFQILEKMDTRYTARIITETMGLEIFDGLALNSRTITGGFKERRDMIKKITPNQAAEVMGCSPQFIRIGMQRNLLDIGDAIKMSSIWTYNISPGKLAARQGITIEQLNDLIKTMG